MKRLLMGLAIVVGAWMLSPTPNADAWGGRDSYDSSWSSWYSWDGNSWCGDKTTAPELDPSSAGSAMVLLLGGVAYMASRRREDDLA